RRHHHRRHPRRPGPSTPGALHAVIAEIRGLVHDVERRRAFRPTLLRRPARDLMSIRATLDAVGSAGTDLDTGSASPWRSMLRCLEPRPGLGLCAGYRRE